MANDNYFTWLYSCSSDHLESVAMDSKFDESKIVRAKKGTSKGGQFQTKPSTIEEQDNIKESSPKPLVDKETCKFANGDIDYRKLRDRLSNAVHEDGTYDLYTGVPRKYTTGYQVSFQEETTEREGHLAHISDEEYSRKVRILTKELGVDPDLGRFGEPEISFHVDSYDKAMEVARRHNQESIWSSEDEVCIPNPDFIGATHYADRDNHATPKYHNHKEKNETDNNQ